MSLFCLNVDFAEKEIVKQLGARWCNELKTWYINDDYVNPTDFIKWIPKIIDNEFSYLYEIDFEDPDCNYRVVMKVKSKKDLSNYKYFFDKKEKWLSGEALQIAVKRREAKSKGEKKDIGI